MRKNTTKKRVAKSVDAYQERKGMNVPRIILINGEGPFVSMVTDDQKLEIYSTDLRPDGTWGEVYRYGPTVDRVWPLTFDRIIGNAHEIGHFGDMAHLLESLDKEERKAKPRNAKTRKAKTRGSQ